MKEDEMMNTWAWDDEMDGRDKKNMILMEDDNTYNGYSRHFTIFIKPLFLYISDFELRNEDFDF